MVLKTVTPRIPTISFWFPPTGQSQWSSLVLVAPRRTSAGEPSPAHHPRHDLPQGPPHRHPQSSHLRHPQAAAVIGPFPPQEQFSDQSVPLNGLPSLVRLPAFLHILSDAHELHLCLIFIVSFFTFFGESRTVFVQPFLAPLSVCSSSSPFRHIHTHTYTHSGRSMKLQHIFERLTSQAGVRNKPVRCLSWHCFCLCSKPVTELKTRVAIANGNCYTSLFKTSVAQTLRIP